MIQQVKRSKIKKHQFTKQELKAALAAVDRSPRDKEPYSVVIDDPGRVNLECLAAANAHYTRSLTYIRQLPKGKVRVASLGKLQLAKKQPH